MRFIMSFVGLALLTLSAAADPSPLYQCKAIVTGTDAERRAPTMVECYRRTLAKAAGDRRLMRDTSVSVPLEQALAAVDGLKLHDRLWRFPIHDEQGTRDRPHDLTVDFRPALIDAELEALGRKPWPGPRPSVVVLTLVRHGDMPFILTSDTARGPGMNEALEAASDYTGIPAAAPSQAHLDAAKIDAGAAAHPSARALDALAQSEGADAVLTGTMTWSEEALGWVSEWRFRYKGETSNWSEQGQNFDAAFRDGLWGAAQVMSGNAQP